jgi:hypothetical protein
METDLCKGSGQPVPGGKPTETGDGWAGVGRCTECSLIVGIVGETWTFAEHAPRLGQP